MASAGREGDKGCFLDDDAACAAQAAETWEQLLAADRAGSMSAPLAKTGACLELTPALPTPDAISCPMLMSGPSGPGGALGRPLPWPRSSVLGRLSQVPRSSAGQLSGPGVTAGMQQLQQEQQLWQRQQQGGHAEQLVLQLQQDQEVWDHRCLASFLHKLPELRGGEEMDPVCLAHLLL